MPIKNLFLIVHGSQRFFMEWIIIVRLANTRFKFTRNIINSHFM